MYGVTADQRPGKTLKDRVVIEALHAAIHRAMGVSPKFACQVERRPFYVTRDGEEQAIEGPFS